MQNGFIDTLYFWHEYLVRDSLTKKVRVWYTKELGYHISLCITRCSCCYRLLYSREILTWSSSEQSSLEIINYLPCLLVWEQKAKGFDIWASGQLVRHQHVQELWLPVWCLALYSRIVNIKKCAKEAFHDSETATLSNKIKHYDKPSLNWSTFFCLCRWRCWICKTVWEDSDLFDLPWSKCTAWVILSLQCCEHLNLLWFC